MPFILLAISSLLLIYEINRKTRNLGALSSSSQRQENQRSLNKTVVFFALLFVIMTSPGAIVTSFLNSVLQSSGHWGLVIISVCDCITFSFHALNFIILIVTNKIDSEKSTSAQTKNRSKNVLTEQT